MRRERFRKASQVLFSWHSQMQVYNFETTLYEDRKPRILKEYDDSYPSSPKNPNINRTRQLLIGTEFLFNGCNKEMIPKTLTVHTA